MDQQKIGVFLKELRQEKQITQEQLADFYDVDLNEIFCGERRGETMDCPRKILIVLWNGVNKVRINI